MNIQRYIPKNKLLMLWMILFIYSASVKIYSDLFAGYISSFIVSFINVFMFGALWSSLWFISYIGIAIHIFIFTIIINRQVEHEKKIKIALMIYFFLSLFTVWVEPYITISGVIGIILTYLTKAPTIIISAISSISWIFLWRYLIRLIYVEINLLEDKGLQAATAAPKKNVLITQNPKIHLAKEKYNEGNLTKGEVKLNTENNKPESVSSKENTSIVKKYTDKLDKASLEIKTTLNSKIDNIKNTEGVSPSQSINDMLTEKYSLILKNSNKKLKTTWNNKIVIIEPLGGTVRFNNITELQIYMENDFVESLPPEIKDRPNKQIHNSKNHKDQLIIDNYELNNEGEKLLNIYIDILMDSNKKIKFYRNGKAKIIEELGGIINFKNITDLNVYIEERYDMEIKKHQAIAKQ